MSAVAGLLWAAAIWSVFFLYCLFDVPTLVARLIRGAR